jgi:hypothetical protein
VYPITSTDVVSRAFRPDATQKFSAARFASSEDKAGAEQANHNIGFSSHHSAPLSTKRRLEPWEVFGSRVVLA